MTTKYKTDDLRIANIKEVANPQTVCDELPQSEATARTTIDARNAIHHILHGMDDRLVVIAGPCSIHDPKAALEYAGRLAEQHKKYAEDLFIVMRVYFEKPRTTVGWKGLINDPDLDESFHINKGLRMARELLLKINEMGVSAGVEYLDIITPQYIADLVSWGAIGARTTESQVHREVASGLSCPVGFKNGTNGNLKIAVDAIGSASRPHHFLTLTKAGESAIFQTTGNDDAHIILRGGKQPNYDAESVDEACRLLEQAGLPQNLMIDFSHANSNKQPERQRVVAEDVGLQIAGGDGRIFGVMIESHLVAGRQEVKPGQDLVYGQSITDACIGWDDTMEIFELLSGAVQKRREKSRKAAS